jgi:hypothetical protein
MILAVLSDLGEPDHPFRHIAGRAFERDYVDIDGLNVWLGKRKESGAMNHAAPA